MTQTESTENIFLEQFHDDELFHYINSTLREQGYEDEHIIELADSVRTYVDGNHFIAQQVWESIPKMLSEQGYTSLEKLAVSMQLQAYIENLQLEKYKEYENL
jgi:hypothetical protein